MAEIRLATKVLHVPGDFASHDSTMVESVQQKTEYDVISSLGIMASIISANNRTPQSSNRGIENVFIGATFVLEAIKWT